MKKRRELEKYRSNYLSAKRDDEISKDVLIIKRCIDRMTELKRENGSWTSADGERDMVSSND